MSSSIRSLLRQAGVGRAVWAARRRWHSFRNHTIKATIFRTGWAQHRIRQHYRKGPPILRILGYHRVLERTADFAFDPNLINLSPAEFRRHMEFVRENFSVITFADLARITNGQQSAPPNPLIVTFDDGYRDNYIEAFPILRELGLPATIFVATGFIGGQKMFWWDRLAYAIRATLLPELQFDLGNGRRLWKLGTPGQRDELRLVVLAKLKQLPEAEKNILLDRLVQALAVDESRADWAAQVLTWDEIREMAARGIEFGSHTRNHPILSKVDDATLTAELTLAREDLTRELGCAPVALAYPVGEHEHYSPAVCRETHTAGYQFGVTFLPGVNDLRGLSRFELKRIGISRQDDFTSFVSRLACPSLP